MNEVPLSRVTLRFASPELESGYVSASARQSLPLIRIALVLGCILYALFGILDLWVVPEAVPVVWGIRAVVCACLLAVWAVTFRPWAVCCLQLLGGSLVLVTGLGIVAMVAAANVEGGAYYYAGLILVVVFAHGLLRLRYVLVSVLTTGVIAAYVLVVLGLKPVATYIVVNNLFFLLSAQVICMFVSYALEYYVRRVYWQRRVLDEQARRLRQEDERKSRELDEIRALQLAMLPRVLPEVPGLEIAVHMSTATEVGGDFYDFHLADDGTLTCAIGDATGHGGRAGAVVAGMKVLFGRLAHGGDLGDMLREASDTFRRSGFSGMYMALALARFRHDVLELAGAGMPPALLHRASTGRVLEIPLEGMPVGAMAGFPYRSQRVAFEPGDALVLMTDGFPELLDGNDDALGYERAADSFAEVASRPPAEIVDHLTRTGAAWAAGSLPGDDVTFVVFKLTPSPTLRDAVPAGSPALVHGGDGRREHTEPPGLERRLT